jgi:hypothetical protein
MTEEYFDELKEEGVTGKQFEWAARQAGKRAMFFPKVADILIQVERYRANPPQSDRTAIAYEPTPDLTPEQEACRQEMIQISVHAVTNKISFEEARRRLKRHGDE